MADIKVPINLPGGDVDFTFGFPMAIVPGKPFPENVLSKGPISLALVRANADKNFKIGGTDKSIAFGVGAEGMAGLGVYRTTARLPER
jgi:hypothetical protein